MDALRDPSRRNLLVVALLAGRLIAAGLLAFGPWTDQPSELRGTDVERFQQIVDHHGTPYRDYDVEYPPGSVLVLEGIAAPDVVGTHQRVVLLGLVADLAVAGILLAAWGPEAALVWLVIGTVSLPAGYLRLDLLAVAAAIGGLALAHRERPGWAGAAVALGFAMKTWPAALIPALWATGRRRAAIWSTALVGAVSAAWVAFAGLDGIRQVTGFRGATGWHVESTPGLLSGLLSGDHTTLEQGSWRLGHTTGAVRALLLAVLAAAAIALVVAAARRGRVAAAGPLGSAGAAWVAGLRVAAPLLSPQYLLWLVPFGAVALVEGDRRTAGLVAAAAVLTALVIDGFSPSGVDAVLPEVLLVVRNLLLAAVAVSGIAATAGARAEPEPVAT
jgi:hypothetical protein